MICFQAGSRLPLALHAFEDVLLVAILGEVIECIVEGTKWVFGSMCMSLMRCGYLGGCRCLCHCSYLQGCRSVTGLVHLGMQNSLLRPSILFLLLHKLESPACTDLIMFLYGFVNRFISTFAYIRDFSRCAFSDVF